MCEPQILALAAAMEEAGLYPSDLTYVTEHIASIREGYTYTTPRAIFIMGWLACEDYQQRPTPAASASGG